MRDAELLRRLPYYADKRIVNAPQLKRVLAFGRALGVINHDDPNGITLYPGPNAGQPPMEKYIK